MIHLYFIKLSPFMKKNLPNLATLLPITSTMGVLFSKKYQKLKKLSKININTVRFTNLVLHDNQCPQIGLIDGLNILL